MFRVCVLCHSCNILIFLVKLSPQCHCGCRPKAEQHKSLYSLCDCSFYFFYSISFKPTIIDHINYKWYQNSATSTTNNTHIKKSPTLILHLPQQQLVFSRGQLATHISITSHHIIKGLHSQSKITNYKSMILKLLIIQNSLTWPYIVHHSTIMYGFIPSAWQVCY